jgi:glycosyltransferase involved in cell wall biosynthesis
MSVWQHATAALVPSEWLEPGGTVAVEAMRVGTPVIATDVGGLPEAVLDEVSGIIIPPRDPAALQAAIERLAGDPDLRARMSAAALARSERFTASHVMAEMRAAYERTIKAHRHK